MGRARETRAGAAGRGGGAGGAGGAARRARGARAGGAGGRSIGQVRRPMKRRPDETHNIFGQGML
jgi:hypothetical protein